MKKSLLFLAALPALALAGEARAADDGVFYTTISERTVLVFNPTTTTTTNISTFQTQIIGQILGGVVVYDQTFALPYSNGTVQAGQTAAIAAITAAGGPGVVIGAPVLTASTTTVTSSNVTTYTLVSSSFIVYEGVVTFGAGTVYVGTLNVCTGLTNLPSTTAPSCSDTGGEELVLGLNDTNINVQTDFIKTIDQAIATTTTTNLFEQYTITGVVQAVGGELPAMGSALADESARFTHRLLNGFAAAAPLEQGDGLGAENGSGWANIWGWQGSDDNRNGFGLEGGANFNLGETVQLDFGVSQGRIGVRLDDSSGSANADLTELGLAARWADQGFYAGGAATAGFGSVNATGLASSANYEVRLYSVAADAGYSFNLADDLTLTPSLGGHWTNIHTSAFTGTGAAPLSSAGSSNEFGKVWLGLEAEKKTETFSISAHARLVGYTGDAFVMPVSFTGSSTILPVAKADRGDFGAELGFAAEAKLTQTLSAFGRYDLTLRDGGTLHSGMIGLKAKW